MSKELEISDEAKETRRQYYREWTRKNPDKVRAKNARYWENKAKQLKQKEEN